MTEPEVSIEIPARAGAIREVRDEVGRCGIRLGMSANRIGELKTIVTEALDNAVLHAYDEEGGTIEITVMRHSPAELEVVVRDFGSGIFPRPDSETPSLRMGLPIIGALSSGFCLESRRGEGTTLTARVPVD